MSNTTTVAVSASWASGTLGNLSISGNVSATQSGTTAAAVTQAIGTTTEALVIPADSVMPGNLIIKNIDPTNFVSLDLNTPVVAGSTAFADIRPGETVVLPTKRTTIYALADTATVNLLILAMPR